jgi:hypothetical protein
MFSNCTIGEDTEWEALKAGIDEAAAYMTEQNFGNGAWMMWRVFGGAGEPDWDFKWVTSYDNYTDFGKTTPISARHTSTTQMAAVARK